MSRKYTFILMFAPAFLLVIAAIAISIPRVSHRGYDYSSLRRFIEDVENGQRDFSEKKAVAIMSAALRGVEAEQRSADSMGRSMRKFGVMLVFWSILQIGAVLYVRTKVKNQNS